MQLKISESAPVVPSTSMAAHPVDTEVEIESEDKIEMVGKASGKIEEGAAYENVSFSLPLPPPPIPKNNYSQVIIASGCLLKFLLMHFFSLNKNILRGMRICSQCCAACISLFCQFILVSDRVPFCMQYEGDDEIIDVQGAD